MQRLRIRFRRGEEVKYISHLDLMRLWQRALVRAGVSLARSEGFNPHPRMSLAAPLAVGITSEAELMDVILTSPLSPHAFASLVGRQLPPGIEILQVFPIALTLPSLQSQVRQVEYAVDAETDKTLREVEEDISSLLARKELPWQHHRDTGPRNYDLRPLINHLWLIGCEGGSCRIGMRLRCDGTGSGRPEQVAAALGFSRPPRSMHRTRLIMGAA